MSKPAWSTRLPSLIPTGFPALDAAFGIGGLPRGRLSQIVGVPTSGAATLTLKLVTNAQIQDGAAAYDRPSLQWPGCWSFINRPLPQKAFNS